MRAYLPLEENLMQLLERHFEIALETPDGIKKLRELILSLAMQGKLVPQDPNDQPASELLKEIEIEKKKLIKEGKIKKQEPLPPIKPEEIPYEVPKGWEWARLGNVGETNIGLTYKPSDISDKGVPVLRSSNIQNGKLDFVDLVRVNTEIKNSALVKEGDLLICARNGSRALVGKTALITGLSEEMAFGAFMAIFRSRINFYLLYFINSPLFRKMIAEVNTMTINQITQNNLKSTIFPIPPLAEQKRIVAKIDQLMALCDKLEAERNERNQKRLTIHTAAINRLFSSSNETDFNTSWGFITQNFNELYSVPENVAELKKAILQLAVMGKLVPQDPNDQPASELLKKIETEKKKLVTTKKLKIGQLTKDTKKINNQISIPKNWKWAKGEDIFFITKLAGFEYTEHIKLTDIGDIPVIRAQNVRPMRLDIENLKYIDLKTSELLARCALTKKALLVTFIGAGIGDVALFDKNERWHLAPNVAKMELFDNCDQFLDLRFINYYLMSVHGRKEIFKHLKSTAQPSISMGTIRDIDYPIPPLAEQKRIVAKIDQLMELCNSLKQQIKDSTDKQTAVLNAVLVKA